MKLAVVFPGMGYHVDKPLLYYGKKMAANFGYEIIEVRYDNLIEKGKDMKKEKQAAFDSALSQTEEILKDVDFAQCETLLFISKSIGTAVASAFAGKHGLSPHHVYFTPVEETFLFAEGEGVVFHGTKDPWIETGLVRKECREKGFPLFLTENGNHSLETGDVLTDLRNLECVMARVKDYLEGLEKADGDPQGRAEELGRCQMW